MACPRVLVSGQVCRREDQHLLNDIDSLDTLPPVLIPPPSQNPSPPLLWYGYPIDFKKFAEFVRAYKPLHPAFFQWIREEFAGGSELDCDETNLSLNDGWSTPFLWHILHDKFPEKSRRLRPVYIRRKGRVGFVLAFFCNFENSEWKVPADELAFARELVSEEGEPKWYLDHSRGYWTWGSRKHVQ